MIRKSAAEICEEKSAEALTGAMKEVPFYRERWRAFDPGPEHGVDERFAALPVLTKADLRACFPAGLVRDGLNVGEGLESGAIEYTFTSGTTGEKVVNLWNQAWWRASERASWLLNPALAALPYPPRQATLASALNVGISCEEDLPMDHRIMGNLLYLNEKANILCWRPYHLERVARELDAYRPDVLEANPSLLARCCRDWLARDRRVWQPKAIVLTYELPSRLSLRAIGQVFSCPCVSSYGTTETGFVLESGADGRMRQNASFCRIDFLPLKERYGGPDLGRLAVTTFGNPWANVIRFDVGDIVRAGGWDREGFAAARMEGRAANATFDCAGGLVTTAAVDEALAEVPGLWDYDLSQPGPGRYALRITAPGRGEAAVRDALDRLHALYGPESRCEVTAVPDLLPGPSGKYRRTHAEFPVDEWSMLEGEIRHA